MNLSNRINSRKILYRLIYMYNFSNAILEKNIYVNFADKIDNIVKQWLDKIDSKEFEKFDFSQLVEVKKIVSKPNYDIKDYLAWFDPKNEKEFNELVSYIINNLVIIKWDFSIEYDYLVENMSYLLNNYDFIVEKINSSLETFKFNELNSVDQSILLLWFVENQVIWTHKNIIIKESLFLASTFTSDSSRKLINAILDKILFCEAKQVNS